jgi:hypothetical protein
LLVELKPDELVGLVRNNQEVALFFVDQIPVTFRVGQ